MICPCCGQRIEGKPDPVAYVAELPFGGHNRDLLEVLAKRFGGIVSREHLIESMYAFDPTGGPLGAHNVLSVVIFKLRPKIKKHGLRLETILGAGYRLMWR